MWRQELEVALADCAGDERIDVAGFPRSRPTSDQSVGAPDIGRYGAENTAEEASKVQLAKPSVIQQHCRGERFNRSSV